MNAVRCGSAGAFSWHDGRFVEHFGDGFVARVRGCVVAADRLQRDVRRGPRRGYKLLLVEVTGRAIGLWYNRDSAPTSDLLLEATLGVGIPF